MVTLAFGIERSRLAGQRLDEDLAFRHASWSFRPLHVLHVERLGNLGTLIT